MSILLHRDAAFLGCDWLSAVNTRLYILVYEYSASRRRSLLGTGRRLRDIPHGGPAAVHDARYRPHRRQQPGTRAFPSVDSTR